MPRSLILDARGQPFAPRNGHAPRPVRARYDAAQTTNENSRHWANSDALSARAANDPAIRRTLRNRARYEIANNSYASGLAETLANDVIGTGPRLQMTTEDPELNSRVDDAFEEWASAIGFAEKLRTYRESRTVDGESFGLLTTNPALPTPVQLDFRLYEADQVATPYQYLPDLRNVDGIEYDQYGNPVYYHLLREHPGDLIHYGEYGAWDRIPAAMMLHWFKTRRPGQCRGVPEITPALPLFAMLRRYTLATLSAAEIAALFAALLKSNLPPDDGTVGIPPFDTQEITRGMMTALPDGYDVTQLKAEQPTTTYQQFKHEILNEIARCLHVPFNVAAGNSSSYNYASGRLDRQTYHRSIGVDRYHLECAVLDRLFREWLREARLADPGSVAGLEFGRRLPPHSWNWDGFAHVDPTKEATAQETRLRNGTSTLADEWAEAGYDWRAKARQQAEEREYYAELGIPYPGDKPAPMPAAAPPVDEGADSGTNY